MTVLFGDDRRYRACSRFLITVPTPAVARTLSCGSTTTTTRAVRDDRRLVLRIRSALTRRSLVFSGVRVATGDFDGDGNDELVTAMGPGGPFMRWRMTGSGRVAELLEQFAPYGGFNGGIFVATGDFDGDGRDSSSRRQTPAVAPTSRSGRTRTATANFRTIR